jgi:hypothetical protein
LPHDVLAFLPVKVDRCAALAGIGLCKLEAELDVRAVIEERTFAPHR